MVATTSNITILINNEAIQYVPNTFKYTEGKGEYNVRAQTSGGGQSEPVTTRNVETSLSMAEFQLFPTQENINKARLWKENFDQNVIQFYETDVFDGRTIGSASVVNDYEVEVGQDSTFTLEWKGASSV